MALHTLCVWVGAGRNFSLEFACICMHMCMLMKSVDQTPSGLSAEALTSEMLFPRSDRTRAERWVQTIRSCLLAWRDAQTRTQKHINVHTSTRRQILNTNTRVRAHPHTDKHNIVREEAVGWREWAPLSRSPTGFQCLEPFYLMNAPKKITVPCIIVYGWTLWLRQLSITHNLSFYIIYFN